ncbi:hypothetical protein LY76DRAFT_173208 [Colletotrichum caudatum]|nr:hypothetical protein LY76DRAFT_173208 [Colletotrichum caudatum]
MSAPHATLHYLRTMDLKASAFDKVPGRKPPWSPAASCSVPLLSLVSLWSLKQEEKPRSTRAAHPTNTLDHLNHLTYTTIQPPRRARKVAGVPSISLSLSLARSLSGVPGSGAPPLGPASCLRAFGVHSPVPCTLLKLVRILYARPVRLWPLVACPSPSLPRWSVGCRRAVVPQLPSFFSSFFFSLPLCL